MASDQNRMDLLARAQELKRRGESARRTPSGISAMSISSRDGQIWRSLVTTRHLDFIGVMKTIRR